MEQYFVNIYAIFWCHFGIFKAWKPAEFELNLKKMKIFALVSLKNILVFSLSTINMMKSRQNLIKTQNNGLMRSFLVSMDEEPAAVSDFREIVYGIETEQVNKSPKISDFIID